MAGEINRINPTVVEGAEDIHGAESFDADYSPLNRPSFSWRDNMAQSRRTLDEKQVGDMMRMRRMGRGRYDAETDDDDDDDDLTDCQVCGEMFVSGALNQHPTTLYTVCYECFENELEEDDEGWVDVEDFTWDKEDYDAETFNAPLSREEVEKLRRKMSYAKGSRPSMRPVENRLAVGQRMKGSMASEGFSDVLGTLIPQPHFVGFEEMQREKMKNRDAKDAESCGNCGSALVMNAEGEHGCGCGTEMEAEETMLGSIGEGNDFGQMEAEEFGAERRYRYGNRYITRDSKGRFKKNVDVGRSLSADRRRKAKTVKGVGQGGKGDYGAEEYFDCGCVYEEMMEGAMCESCGHTTCIDCSQNINTTDANYKNWRCYEGYGCNKGAEEFNTEETSLGLIGEGNDFGQMEAEGDVVDLTQGVLAKGGVRVGGMTASAIVLAIAGLSGYYYARR